MSSVAEKSRPSVRRSRSQRAARTERDRVAEPRAVQSQRAKLDARKRVRGWLWQCKA